MGYHRRRWLSIRAGPERRSHRARSNSVSRSQSRLDRAARFSVTRLEISVIFHDWSAGTPDKFCLWKLTGRNGSRAVLSQFLPQSHAYISPPRCVLSNERSRSGFTAVHSIIHHFAAGNHISQKIFYTHVRMAGEGKIIYKYNI